MYVQESACLVLRNFVLHNELAEGIESELREECAMYGTVVSVRIYLCFLYFVIWFMHNVDV